MSAAQEEEVRQLTMLLEASESARRAAEAKAEGLQSALFESSLKCRAAVEQCRRDALEVAVEEVCKVKPSHTNKRALFWLFSF